VNGSPTSLATLEEMGGWLIDLHGPHDHQSLLQPRLQLSLVDAYGGLNSQRESFAEQLSQRSRLQQAKAALIVDEGDDKAKRPKTVPEVRAAPSPYNNLSTRHISHQPYHSSPPPSRAGACGPIPLQ
jgi:DNA repair protein RecN (Recombination protein N)